MSNGPILIKEEKFTPQTYYHLHLTPRDWCGYFKGPCAIDHNIGEQYCWACQYRRPLDIPNLLAERGRS
jgi:hypothetical protein